MNYSEALRLAQSIPGCVVARREGNQFEVRNPVRDLQDTLSQALSESYRRIAELEKAAERSLDTPRSAEGETDASGEKVTALEKELYQMRQRLEGHATTRSDLEREAGRLREATATLKKRNEQLVREKLAIENHHDTFKKQTEAEILSIRAQHQKEIGALSGKIRKLRDTYEPDDADDEERRLIEKYRTLREAKISARERTREEADKKQRQQRTKVQCSCNGMTENCCFCFGDGYFLRDGYGNIVAS